MTKRAEFRFKAKQDLPDAALKIIRPTVWSNRDRTRKYRVFYTCCQRYATVSEALIKERVRNESKTCKLCADGSTLLKAAQARRTFKYAVDQELGNALLKIVSQDFLGHNQRTTNYTVKHLCCGNEEVMNERAIHIRNIDPRVRCTLCPVKESSKKTRQYEKQRAEKKKKKKKQEKVYETPRPMVFDTWTPPPSTVDGTK